jgi:hypothetical protein
MLPAHNPMSFLGGGILTSLSEVLFLREMRLGTSNGLETLPPPPTAFSRHYARVRAIGGLNRRSAPAVAGVATVAAAGVALALIWHWIALVDLVPVLYVLPCALLMLMCVKGMSRGQGAEGVHTSYAPELPAATRNRT